LNIVIVVRGHLTWSSQSR